MKIKKIVSIALLGLSVVSLASCGGDDAADPNKDDTQEAERTMRYIYVNSNGAQTQFYIGDSFNSQGLVVMANYSDGTNEAVSMDNVTINSSKFNNTKKGNYDIDITYATDTIVKTASYRVTVNSILDDIEHLIGITCFNPTTTFAINTEFDHTGMTVTANYLNPTTNEIRTEDITNSVEVDSTQYVKNKVGTYEIVIRYSRDYTSNGKSETVNASTFYHVEVESTLTNILLTSKVISYDAYTIGDDGSFNSPDTSNWKVYATYGNMSGNVELDKSEYTYTITDGNFTSDPTASGYQTSYTVVFSYTYKGKTMTTNMTISIVPVKTPLVELDVKKITAGIYATPTAINSTFTIQAVDGGTVLVDEDSRIQYPSSSAIQYTFLERIKLQGNGSRDARSIKMDLEANRTVTAYVMSDSSSEAALAGFYNTDGITILEQSVNGGDEITKITFTTTTAGTYYLWGTGSLNVYYIAVTAA